MARRKRSRARNGNLFLRFAIIFLLVSIAGVTAMGFMYNNTAAPANTTNNSSNADTEEDDNADADDDMRMSVEKDVIYDNIFINNVDVGGLTKEQALDKIDDQFQADLGNKEITFVYGGESKVFKFSEFGAGYDYTQAVETAYRYARDGSTKERYNKVKALDKTPFRITYEPEYTYDSGKIEDVISPIAESLYIAPVDAGITRSNGVFAITPESSGRRLNVEKAVQEINELLASNKEGSVEGLMEEAPPRYTAKDMEQAQSLIGTCSTTFTGTNADRNTNIINAASKINDVVVYPDEVFSTNYHFGPSTYENGYRDAPVIIGGRLENGIGGGMCQVSSALYNAVLYAELAVVERQNHSMKVGYMDYGFDATLAGDYIDLKFKNSTKLPIFIETVIIGNKLTVNIYGYEEHSSGRKLEFKNELYETVPHGPDKITEDPTLPEGETVVDNAAKDGYKYNVYKIVYENGKEVERVKINSSYYKPATADVRVGTGEAVVEGIADGETEEDGDAAQSGEDGDGTEGTEPTDVGDTVGQGSADVPLPELDPIPTPTPENNEGGQQTPQVDEPYDDEPPVMPD